MFAFPAKKKPYSKKLIAKLWSAVLPNSIVTIHSQNSFLADIFILARLILFVNPYSGFLLFFVRSLLLFPLPQQSVQLFFTHQVTLQDQFPDAALLLEGPLGDLS